MKNVSVGLFAALILALVKILKVVFKFLYYVIGKICIYLGLHFPLLYLFITSFFMIFKKIDFAKHDLNYLLFFIGLMISFFCMLTTLIKNLIVNPKGLKEYFRKKQQENSPSENQIENPQKEQNTNTTIKKYPIVYPSQNNPNIIIFEYETKYDVYFKDANGITQIDTKPKNLNLQ